MEIVSGYLSGLWKSQAQKPDCTILNSNLGQHNLRLSVCSKCCPTLLLHIYMIELSDTTEARLRFVVRLGTTKAHWDCVSNVCAVAAIRTLQLPPRRSTLSSSSFSGPKKADYSDWVEIGADAWWDAAAALTFFPLFIFRPTKEQATQIKEAKFVHLLLSLLLTQTSATYNQ